MSKTQTTSENKTRAQALNRAAIAAKNWMTIVKSQMMIRMSTKKITQKTNKTGWDIFSMLNNTI